MVTLGYILLALAPVVCFAWIVWNHRKKEAARAAARSERLVEIFGGTGPAAGGAAPPGNAAESTVAAGAKPVAASMAPLADGHAPAPEPLYSARASLLDAPRAQLYAALRRSLPQHNLFVQVSLAALLDVPDSVQGRAREQRSRALSQYAVDCVVCDADLRVLAAVDVDSTLDADARFKAEALKAAGIRHLRIDPARAETELPALISG